MSANDRKKKKAESNDMATLPLGATINSPGAALNEAAAATDDKTKIQEQFCLIHRPAADAFLGRQCLIKVKRVTFNYGPHVILKNISEDIYEGETYAIIGSSGSGKSTLLKMMAGLAYPTTGDIIVHGINLSSMSKAELMNTHQQHAFIFQLGALIQNMRLFDNIALPLRYHYPDMPDSEISEKVRRLLEQFELLDDEFNLPSQLSQGEVKLAAFARGLISDPSLVFMDEPLTGLDHIKQQKVLRVIRELKSRGKTMVIVTHNTNLAIELADRICIVRNGSIYACDYPQTIRQLNDTYTNEIMNF